MKQFEQSKKEYIGKLKRELETIEEKHGKLMHQIEMTSEDNRSRATANRNAQIKTQLLLEDTIAQLEQSKQEIADKAAEYE